MAGPKNELIETTINIHTSICIFFKQPSFLFGSAGLSHSLDGNTLDSMDELMNGPPSTVRALVVVHPPSIKGEAHGSLKLPFPFFFSTSTFPSPLQLSPYFDSYYFLSQNTSKYELRHFAFTRQQQTYSLHITGTNTMSSPQRKVIHTPLSLWEWNDQRQGVKRCSRLYK